MPHLWFVYSVFFLFAIANSSRVVAALRAYDSERMRALGANCGQGCEYILSFVICIRNSHIASSKLVSQVLKFFVLVSEG